MYEYMQEHVSPEIVDNTKLYSADELLTGDLVVYSAINLNFNVGDLRVVTVTGLMDMSGREMQTRRGNIKLYYKFKGAE